MNLPYVKCFVSLVVQYTLMFLFLFFIFFLFIYLFFIIFFYCIYIHSVQRDKADKKFNLQLMKKKGS